MENLRLYTPNGVEIPLVSYANNSIPTEVKCTMEWQGDESISLRIESATPIEIPLYSYVDYKGVRFRMNRPAEVKKEYDTLEYGIELESARYEFGRVLYDTSVDPTQAALSKVYSGGSFGNLYHFADILVANIKRALGATWKIEGAAKDDKGGQLLSFERSENCLSALHKIAQAFHVLFFTSEDVNSGVRTIRFVSEYEYNPQPREEWNIGSELFSVDRKYMGSDNVITRLWAFGSQEGAEKAGDRLTLPSKDMTNSYIEDSEKVRLYGLSEGVYIDEEAKPTYTGDVTKETDDPYTFQSASWLMFSKLQDGETAKVHFETGGLQGMEFSVKRVKDGKITINPIVDKDLKLEYPSKDSSSPYRVKVGDTFKCLGVEYPLWITLSARDRLQASATLHYNEVSSPKMEYSLVLRDGFDTSVKVGDVVTIIDDSIPQGGRANLIVQQIDVDIIARECSIQVSNFRRKRRIEDIYKGWKERLNGILDYIDLKGYQAESFAWFKGLEEHSSFLDRRVELKEDKSNAKTKYEQLDREIHKRVPREFFDRKIAEYVQKGEFQSRINGLVPLKDFTDLRTIVNNEISSWTLESVPNIINKDITASAIQSYNSEPYNSWGKVGTNRNLDSHVGDTWLVNKASIPENGKVYRFVKGSKPNTYRWVQLSDSPALIALNKIASLSQSLTDTKEYFNTNLGARVFEEFNARKDELKGENGAGVRANLWRYESSLFKPNKGVAVDNVACTHNGGGVYRITKGSPAYEFYFSEFTDKLQGEKTSKVWICSFRLLGSSRPEVVDFSKLGEKNGRYYIVCNNAKKESELRGTFKLYSLPNMTFQEGDWVEFCDYKVELVDDGEPLEPTAYIPHVDDLRGIPGISPNPIDVAKEIDTSSFREYLSRDIRSNQEFSKACKGEPGDPGKSVSVSDLHIGWDGTSLVVDGQKSPSLKGEPGVSPSALAVANEINTASFREGLANTVVSDVTTDPNNLAKIRRGMVVETKYNEDRGKIIKRVEYVEKEIVPFAFVEVGTYSSDWRDYTDNEYVGGGHKPDPWGGGGIDGYIRTVHNYELYRSVQNLPPKYIEQSKKILKTAEYQIGEKWHRDVSATIVYDAQEIQGVEKGSARCWDIFTSPHVDSLLRYGKNTRMANPNMQGQKHGSGADAYWNVYLEKNTNYRIFANNDGSGKYRLYVVKNGAY